MPFSVDATSYFFSGVAQTATADNTLVDQLARAFRSHLAAVGVNPFLIVGFFALLIVAVIVYWLLRPRIFVRREIERLFQTLVRANGLSAEEEQELRAAVAVLRLTNPLVVFTRRSLLDRHAEMVSNSELEPRRTYRIEKLKQLMEKLYT